MATATTINRLSALRRPAVIVFLICLAIRAVYAWIHYDPQNPYHVWQDGDQYIGLAQSLNNSGELRLWGRLTSLRVPGYPFLVALSWKLSQPHHFACLAALQVLLSSLAGACLFLATRKLFGPVAGAISVGIYAIDPLMLLRTHAVASEIPSAIMTIVSAWLFGRVQERYSIGRVVACALGFLGAFNVRVEVGAAMIFMACASILTARAFKRSIGQWTPARLGLLLTLFAVGWLPWVWRNWKVHRAFVPTTTEGGFNFMTKLGAHDGKFAWGLEGLDFVHTERDVHGIAKGLEVQRDRLFFQTKIKRMKEQPAQALKIMIRNVVQLYYPVPFFYFNLYDPIFGFTLVFFILGAAHALRLAWKGHWQGMPLVAGVVGFTLAYMMVAGHSRYRSSLQPLIIMLAGLGLTKCYERMSRERFLTFTGSVVGIQGLLFAFYREPLKGKIILGALNLFGWN